MSFSNTKEWELSGMTETGKEDCSSVNMLGENMDKDFPQKITTDVSLKEMFKENIGYTHRIK